MFDSYPNPNAYQCRIKYILAERPSDAQRQLTQLGQNQAFQCSYAYQCALRDHILAEQNVNPDIEQICSG